MDTKKSKAKKIIIILLALTVIGIAIYYIITYLTAGASTSSAAAAGSLAGGAAHYVSGPYVGQTEAAENALDPEDALACDDLWAAVQATGIWNGGQMITWNENANLRMNGSYTGGVSEYKINGVLPKVGALAATIITWDFGTGETAAYNFQTLRELADQQFNQYKNS